MSAAPSNGVSPIHCSMCYELMQTNPKHDAKHLCKKNNGKPMHHHFHPTCFEEYNLLSIGLEEINGRCDLCERVKVLKIKEINTYRELLPETSNYVTSNKSILRLNMTAMILLGLVKV